MKTSYYLRTDLGREGPYQEEDLLDLLGEGKISPDTKCEDMRTGHVALVGELFLVLDGEPTDPVAAAEVQEEILYAAHPMWTAYASSLFLATTLLAAGWYFAPYSGLYLALGVGGAALLLVTAALRRNAVDYLVSTRFVELKKGTVLRSEIEISVRSIQFIRVESTLLEGIFGGGSVVFSTTESGSPDIIFHHAPRAAKAKQCAQLAREGLR